MDEIAQTVFCMWAGVITLDYAGVSEELLEHVRTSFPEWKSNMID